MKWFEREKNDPSPTSSNSAVHSFRRRDKAAYQNEQNGSCRILPVEERLYRVTSVRDGASDSPESHDVVFQSVTRTRCACRCEMDNIITQSQEKQKKHIVCCWCVHSGRRWLNKLCRNYLLTARLSPRSSPFSLVDCP